MKARLFRPAALCALLTLCAALAPAPDNAAASAGGSAVALKTSPRVPQRGRARRRPRLEICHDPTLPCRSTATFEPHDLPFRVPARAVIWETGEFYAVILKSFRAPEEDCEKFVPESERLAAQELFPRRKVFASRCWEPGTLFYTNTTPTTRFMAVYAGQTRAEAERVLAQVRATGRFPGANLRRMRTGFNGT